MSGEASRYGDASDNALLKWHVQGDHEAFGELVKRHQDRLWAVALRTLGNQDDAADALQDALINAFRRAGSFRSESAVTTWLHRIVVNACLDRVRHSAARPADPVAFDGTESPALRSSLGSGNDPAENTALRLDVEAALATLPDEQRVPLVLVDIEGYRVAEVAEMLDLPVGTVKSRCARGRARLLPLLSDADSSRVEGNRSADRRVRPSTASEFGGEIR
ncbi:RNA polymerase sigma factor SigM [Phytoactinopolyspora alkaliphila]|uniref:RNA polymerase sigma factor SigM n=1 Tax=Phytoactinopolyspora alkaliphila TaxID=1783498 RepID=A0A6N9YKU0_9ACTN|nr:RNA polymerase sigma factor SigM [Phytoactinopolyspora alkaliphila]